MNTYLALINEYLVLTAAILLASCKLLIFTYLFTDDTT